MFILLFLLLIAPPPKQEMRGVWLTTVVNLDWPSARTLSTEQQQQELIRNLDEIKAMGMNAVFFQVRTEADALFPSPYEPWSYWLSGMQGVAPIPIWDPLEFAVQESHKRGLELHAWMNPYRAHRDTNTYKWSADHIGKRNPDWMLYFTSSTGTYAMLNPGMPEVRQFVADVVADIVQRYDVDGIHFDDYFYPYNPKITREDEREFKAYGSTFKDVHDWRRDNINKMVAQVHDTIKAIDPLVKFGISPFGIRLNCDAGTRGTEGYHSLYADALAWFEAQKMDYITPQLYWETTHQLAPYEPLLNWWSQAAASFDRHLYVGLAPYRPWPASELSKQILLNRRESNGSDGVIYFRTKSLIDHPGGFQDSLKTNYYSRKALVPHMPWLMESVPEPIDGIQFDRSERTSIQLTWDDVDGAARYAIYRFTTDHLPYDPTLPADAEHLIEVTGMPSFVDTDVRPGTSYVYLVTAVSRNSQESAARAVWID